MELKIVNKFLALKARAEAFGFTLDSTPSCFEISGPHSICALFFDDLRHIEIFIGSYERGYKAGQAEDSADAKIDAESY